MRDYMRLVEMTDHELAALLLRTDALDRFTTHAETVTWVDSDGAVVAEVVFDNATCTRKIWLPISGPGTPQEKDAEIARLKREVESLTAEKDRALRVLDPDQPRSDNDGGAASLVEVAEFVVGCWKDESEKLSGSGSRSECPAPVQEVGIGYVWKARLAAKDAEIARLKRELVAHAGASEPRPSGSGTPQEKDVEIALLKCEVGQWKAKVTSLRHSVKEIQKQRGRFKRQRDEERQKRGFVEHEEACAVARAEQAEAERDKAIHGESLAREERIEAEKREAALREGVETVYLAAINAIAHVGAANYAEREVEAKKWVRETRAAVLAASPPALCGRLIPPKNKWRCAAEAARRAGGE